MAYCPSSMVDFTPCESPGACKLAGPAQIAEPVGHRPPLRRSALPLGLFFNPEFGRARDSRNSEASRSSSRRHRSKRGSLLSGSTAWASDSEGHSFIGWPASAPIDERWALQLSSKAAALPFPYSTAQRQTDIGTNWIVTIQISVKELSLWKQFLEPVCMLQSVAAGAR